jgi:hypothetical protein
MRISALVSIIFFILSCGSGDVRLVRKKLQNKDIIITWYYHSFITNNSPDYVVLERDGVTNEIYKAERVITDVALSKNNIILRLVKPSLGVVYTEKIQDNILGYKIIVDTTDNIESLRFIPDGIKE